MENISIVDTNNVQEYLAQDEGAVTPPPATPPPLENMVVNSSPAGSLTRTVAIIKNHALESRFDIEPRIQEARFEIVKERQMEIDTESDFDTLYELFGEDAVSFKEGPVWVYVLERRRAVEVWQTLMGDPDPAVAKAHAPNSLRALFGRSLLQNAVMGSPDEQIAEIQIASLFASSPPFPNTELPPDEYGLSMRSASSSLLSALRKQTSDEGYAASSGTNQSGKGRPNLVSNSSSFKARPLPATHISPDIVPRMTKSAALRAGIVLDKKAEGPRVIPTREQQKAAFMDVPGHKRSGTISVASTAAPAIAPRMTRAASLRLGIKPEASPPRVRNTRSDGTEPNKTGGTFEGIPGHKRRESITVSSTKAPTVAPRLNKSAALRAQKDKAPPSSFMFRGSSESKPLSRSNSRTSLNGASAGRPSISRPGSSASTNNDNSISRGSRPSPAPRLSASVSRATGASFNGSVKPSTGPSSESASNPSTPVKAKAPRPSSISAPTIAPRMNKSAALRLAKKEAEEEAAKKKNAKMGGGSVRSKATAAPRALVA